MIMCVDKRCSREISNNNTKVFSRQIILSTERTLHDYIHLLSSMLDRSIANENSNPN